MGIIKTFGEYVNESVSYVSDDSINFNAVDIDTIASRINATKTVWNALKKSGLDKYWGHPYFGPISTYGDIEHLESLFPYEESEDFYTQHMGVFVADKFQCEWSSNFENVDSELNYINIYELVVCPDLTIKSSNKDIDLSIYFDVSSEKGKIPGDGDYGNLCYSLKDDYWFYEGNYEGDLENDDLHSDVAKFISVITEAINPDTKYKLSWFKNEESPIEENENTDTYSYTVDDWESGDETEYAGFLKKAGATSIKYEHEDEGGDFHILFTPYPGVTIEQLAKKFAVVQKRAYPHNDYDEVWFYNRTKDKPVKIVI